MLLFDDSKKLEKALGEEAAAVIAHVFERADEGWRRELATKADLQEVRVEMQTMRNDLIKWMFTISIAQTAVIVAVMGVVLMVFLK